jgi:hypothetical protein
MTPEEINGHGFENLNPYQSVLSLVANSPDELARAISSIKAPIKIIGFTAYGTKQVCYFLGSGFKMKKTENKKLKG